MRGRYTCMYMSIRVRGQLQVLFFRSPPPIYLFVCLLVYLFLRKGFSLGWLPSELQKSACLYLVSAEIIHSHNCGHTAFLCVPSPVQICMESTSLTDLFFQLHSTLACLPWPYLLFLSLPHFFLRFGHVSFVCLLLFLLTAKFLAHVHISCHTHWAQSLTTKSFKAKCHVLSFYSFLKFQHSNGYNHQFVMKNIPPVLWLSE